MKMNVPNTLTIVRVLLIPFFVAFMICNITSYDNYIALVIFVVASLTDTLDGYLARKNNEVTNFGKFMDPLADKLLVCSALICLLSNGLISTVEVLIIIAREFIISGFRLVAVDNGIRSIAFPSISTGIYHFPLYEAVKIAVRTAKEFAAEYPGELDVIKWVLFDDNTLKAYADEIEHWRVSEMVQSPNFYSMNKMLRDGGC